MRIARNIFATAFAVVLASGLAACEAEQTKFQETPPAEEIRGLDQEQQDLQRQRQNQQPMQPGQQNHQATPPAQQYQ